MAVSQKPRKKRVEPKVINIKTVQESLWFPIDWDKVETLEDMKFIIKNMGLGCSNQAPSYEELKKYLSDTPTIQN
jgi:hypothetical protein